ncbi:histidine kinase [Photobacterium leiognathi subsp. mandapamensis]|uniref:NACHT domain-containing protein n=1 Tax=Photobacterium leiognathi TaxID=553611 RepID=UPI000D15F11F|nr:NACHT domain-containing protein [Photobacterium leiognathi]PSV04324.1 histidine kinase [Photobacterium leiognathi subsp. mandapamensis]
MEDLLKKATGGLEGIALDIINAASGVLKDKLAEAFAIEKLKVFRENIQRIGFVKTILNPDSIKKLNDIYFDKTVAYDGYHFESFSQFRRSHILIEGGPGQGKSLFLRKLCLNEAKGSSLIPIFIEFRNLKFEQSLRIELIDAINELGVRLSPSMFDFVAKSNKVVLFLDGFDEIPNNSRRKAARELENIGRTYPDLKILISSRPDAGMGGSYYFSKIKIDPMPIAIQKEFIEHLYKCPHQCKSINDILDSSTFLSEVTVSPLLLTLFAITYNSRQFKPDSLSEFYSLIFPTMLYRHDRMKVGFERERKSNLTDFQMQKVFDLLSFLSLQDNNTRFSTYEFSSYLEKVIKIERLNENLENLLIADISDITALIIKDGYDDYSYTHKSIQEYFAAIFINRLPEEKKSAFYNMIVDKQYEFTKWQNSLAFLETIDQRNYLKYFLIPFKKKLLRLTEKKTVKMNYIQVMHLLGEDTRVLVTEDGVIKKFYWGDTAASVLYKSYSDFAKSNMESYLISIRREICDVISFSNADDYDTYRTHDGDFLIPIDYLIHFTNNRAKLASFISRKFDKSKFKREVIELEEELNFVDTYTDEILPF